MGNLIRNPLQLVPRSDHGISRAYICPHALKVMCRLRDAGYQSYLVGGGVRDLLVGMQPKDFDIATDARPEEVRALFRNCRLIGRRFRLAHIHFGRECIEVATFRGSGSSSDDDGHRKTEGGRIIVDNAFGTLEEDAKRRDFTVNALYYATDDFAVRDYAGGFQDLHQGVIRLIGNPTERYREDPVRLLRAVRFAAKLDFTIEAATEAPLRTMGEALADIPPARLFEEVLKLFLTGHAERSFKLLRRYGLFGCLFPATCEVLQRDEAAVRMLEAAMRNTDERIAQDKPVTPAFLLATLLWPPMRTRQKALTEAGRSLPEAVHMAADWIARRQVGRTAIPRRFTIPMREIWQLQLRFANQHGKRAQRMLGHPKFRAAYDFLLLRTVEDTSLKPLADWWTAAQHTSADDEPSQSPIRTPRRRRRRHRPRSRAGDPTERPFV